MDEEFHIIDVMDYSYPYLNLQPNCEYYVYISKKIYDKQLLCGQETEERTENQLKIDVPRSKFYIDGEPILKYRKFLKTSLARYCTQTVMGVPVELLTNYGIVAECSKPERLNVQVWGDSIFISKKLRVLKNDFYIPVEVKLNTDMQDNCVIIRFSTGSYKKFSLLV
tara:strand:- start:782 stop:1282 length:501 start_codon:yes stop_codon:yes gene_type:complete